VTSALVRHFCSAASLTGWIGEFVSGRIAPSWSGPAARHDVEFIPDHLDVARTVDLVRRFPAADIVVIHPEHRTLLRDAAVSANLAADGMHAFVLSPRAAAFGVDKAATREELVSAGIAVPDGTDDPATTRVVKSRAGTQGSGARLVRPGAPADPTPEELVERFVHGTEYSVNLFRCSAGTWTFPVVWKGDTRLDLIPPYGRVRMCAPNRTPATLDRDLRAQAVATAEVLDVQGFAEVESVVPIDEGPLVLEVNPRISGTLRMSAMAAVFPFLELYAPERIPSASGLVHHLRAEQAAAERPFSAAPFTDLAAGVIATSRLTLTAESESLALARLEKAVSTAHGVGGGVAG
jgi:carbamoylphosphate synthase large subunit